MEIGEILKIFRKWRQMTRNDVAKCLKIAPSTLYRLEHGGKFDLTMYIKYCELLALNPCIPLMIYRNQRLINIINNDSYQMDQFINELNRKLDEAILDI